MLMGRHLTTCRLLVTTRPWRTAEVKRRCQSTYAQVELQGFNKEDVREYIRKFFKHEKSMGDSLIEHLNQNSLASEIASIPLMVLLLSVYWRQVQEKALPRKIGQLFNAIINIMHHHYVEKNKDTKSTGLADHDDDIKQLVCRMGKMALQGFWPPENRVVFSPDEASSANDVEMACKIGLISQQESSISVMLDLTNRKQTTLTFFHKTCGEKCAGEYLARLADVDPKELSSKLRMLKTVQEALSVQLILQFACGSNIKAADMILHRLMDIYEPELRPIMSRYSDEKLQFEETLPVQNFIDLCLRCNYEGGAEDQFSGLLFDLFSGGNVYFFGISAFSAVALGYYLSHCQPDYIRSIKLRASGHNTDDALYTGTLGYFFRRATKELTNVPVSDMQNICKDYLAKHPNMHSSNAAMAPYAPAVLLSLIQVWQACEGLPTPQESNIAPIIDSLKHTHLEVFNIEGFRIGKVNIDNLLIMIERGNLSHLLALNVGKIGMNGCQMDRLAIGIKKMPHLNAIDVSWNESNKCLSILSESLPSMQSLQTINVNGLSASVEDMTEFAKKFPQCRSRLLTLKMDSNHMDDVVSSLLTEHLPIARLLREFSISVHGLSKACHNQLLLTMSHLSRLQWLMIYDSQYPDDMMMNMANVMQSLPDLVDLTLSTGNDTSPQVNSVTWQHFKASLQNMSKLRALFLVHIALEKDDFTDLVLLCRRIQYSELVYFSTCLPEGVDIPQDEFLTLW
ncbi:uncharacterized protein [Amphiura filiformis]|uniref:uncharacterized protein n=1 Tax=Amphiura filiformis TaxID=82378 RepID=UPI003B2162D4